MSPGSINVTTLPNFTPLVLFYSPRNKYQETSRFQRVENYWQKTAGIERVNH